MILRPDWTSIHSLIDSLYEEAKKAGLCSNLREFLQNLPLKRTDAVTGEEVDIKLMDFVDHD